MIPLKEWDYNNLNLSSYFVLHFFLRESLEKVFCFCGPKIVGYEYVDVREMHCTAILCMYHFARCQLQSFRNRMMHFPVSITPSELVSSMVMSNIL